MSDTSRIAHHLRSDGEVSEPGQDQNPASPERERANFDQTIPPVDVVAQWEAA